MTGLLPYPAGRVRVRSLFTGVVQGVGFRPFIWRIAQKNGLSGFVGNTSDGVVVEVEGPGDAVEKFFVSVDEELPPLADITGVVREAVSPLGEDAFRIIASERTGRSSVHIPADIAVCENCLRELFDPADRRYRYPFINCTDCGPRLTIIGDIPYDRTNTSMAAFPLCPRCAAEYKDPADRRFHAEPNACPACGPSLLLVDEKGEEIPADDPIGETIRRLKAGAIVAMKGIGGFHLAVDATNEDAVCRLRTRKLREEKPFALMVRDVDQAKEIAEVGQQEERLLVSPQRPIVLVSKKEGTDIAGAVAPGMATFGIMLPYAPLHHVLFEEGVPPLVMTSGNQSGEPIAITNDDAVSRLSGIADRFLIHNREILVRCDDSVAMVVDGTPALLRRSRGYVPGPIRLSATYPEVLAVGGHVKAAVCVLKGKDAFMSPYIGDMDTPAARDYFYETVALMGRITETSPAVVACDLHPGYFTTAAARRIVGRTVIPVQHHHAHIVSCMAENGISGRVIGVAMDGTGYGIDGTIWGGEFFVADEVSFVRAGHLAPFFLPGGESAIHEPWKTAAALLWGAFGGGWRDLAERLDLIPPGVSVRAIERIIERKINSPVTTSVGRVFDGVAAILGIRGRVNFEGQAAMELEACARGRSNGAFPFDLSEQGGVFILDLFPTIRTIAGEALSGSSRGELAAAFHGTLIAGIEKTVGAIHKKTDITRVVLSGGCFQNRILIEGVIEVLKTAGIEVHSHRRVPTNDGGIALGQAVSAGARAKAGMED